MGKRMRERRHDDETGRVMVVEDGSVFHRADAPKLGPRDEMLIFRDLGAGLREMIARVAPRLPDILRSRLDATHESRIQSLVDAYLVVDPFSTVEAEIDDDNARMRAKWLGETRCLTSAQVHALSKSTSRNTSQTANAWKRTKRIFAVEHDGRDLYPQFQFDEAGKPRPAVARILDALPDDASPWQIAFWFSAQNGRLGGRSPRQAVFAGDDAGVAAAIAAAREFGDLSLG